MKKTIIIIAVIAVLVAVIFILGGGVGKTEEAKTIIGSWQHKSGYTYTFNEDKTGTYSIDGRYMEFTYEDKGDSVSILNYGNTNASEYEYRIEGNKLIIKDTFGSDVEYTKK